jgi:hypothetical protein
MRSSQQDETNIRYHIADLMENYIAILYSGAKLRDYSCPQTEN